MKVVKSRKGEEEDHSSGTVRLGRKKGKVGRRRSCKDIIHMFFTTHRVTSGEVHKDSDMAAEAVYALCKKALSDLTLPHHKD